MTVYSARFDEGAALPSIRVQASFDLVFREPIDDEGLEAWQEDNDAFLTDCISFWWSFANPADDWNGVFDCEEAGAHLE